MLTHLEMLVDGAPTKGALLLFGKKPKRQILSAEINCLHFHGTKIAKPIPSQQVYTGTLFEMVDSAVDFVMGKLNRSVVPSSQKVASDVSYDIPYKAVREAVVNAAAHRSYSSNACVQVMLFADRLEVRNPGGLPEDLTLEQLRRSHPSVPRNRLLSEPLFLTRYIERAGTGTLDMISLCAEAGLPEPQFRTEGECFITTLWRDWLTDDVLVGFGLNERQIKAVEVAKKLGELSNSHYREIVDVSESTALRDLRKLVTLGVLMRIGGTGRLASYAVAHHKPVINPS